MKLCDSCGEPATHFENSWDDCPTDRGTERRCYVESLCDQCWKEQGYEKKRSPRKDKR
jgi:hypothetical protein